MAHEGQEIVNPRTGQRLTFLELRGDLMRVESVNPPSPEREPVHVHPQQESGAEVVEGSLVFEVAGEQRRLGAGDTISIGELDPRGMPRPLQLAVLVPEFGDEIRPASPPWPVLRVLGALLGPIARRRGYRRRLELPG